MLGAAAGVGITALRGGNSGLNAVVGSLRGDRKLEVGLLDEPTSLDIRSNSERSVQQALMGNVYETLVTFNDEQAIASGLAARWTQTTDGLRYTFFLRNGLTFSDGTPLDASSVVGSLQQTLAGDRTNDGLSNITAVENNDARSVTFTLSSPNPRLLPALASQAGAIVNPNATNPDFARHSYGSGPFMVNAVQPGSIELTRNEHYWGDKPETSQATLRYYTDEQKMADDLKAGKLNVALPVRPTLPNSSPIRTTSRCKTVSVRARHCWRSTARARARSPMSRCASSHAMPLTHGRSRMPSRVPKPS